MEGLSRLLLLRELLLLDLRLQLLDLVRDGLDLVRRRGTEGLERVRERLLRLLDLRVRILGVLARLLAGGVHRALALLLGRLEQGRRLLLDLAVDAGVLVRVLHRGPSRIDLLPGLLRLLRPAVAVAGVPLLLAVAAVLAHDASLSQPCSPPTLDATDSGENGESGENGDATSPSDSHSSIVSGQRVGLVGRAGGAASSDELGPYW